MLPVSPPTTSSAPLRRKGECTLGGADCTVVILNWNNRDLLRRSLVALHAAPPSKYRLEFIVVDNGSMDGSQDLIRSEFPAVRLIENGQNLGIARGKNVGLQAANTEFVLLLDDDTTIHPWQLDTLIDAARTHPEAGVVTCMKVDPSGTPMYQYHVPSPPTLGLAFFLIAELSLIEVARAAKRRLKWGEVVPHETKDLVEIPYIGGGIMLARAEAIREVGLLDGSIFFFGEDFDWCFRFRRKGWKILYLPKLRVISGYGVNAARTKLASLVALQSRRHLFEKHVGRRYLPLYRAIALVGLLPKLTYYGIRDLSRRGDERDISTYRWLANSIRYIRTPGPGQSTEISPEKSHAS